MKKRYEKPRIFIEKFEMSEHIAGCNLTLTNSVDVLNCVATGTVTAEGMDPFISDAWFVDANTSCETEADAYCLMNASINVATINS